MSCGFTKEDDKKFLSNYSVNYMGDGPDIFISTASSLERLKREQISKLDGNKNKNDYTQLCEEDNKDKINIHDSMKIYESVAHLRRVRRGKIRRSVLLLLVAMLGVIFLVNNFTVDSIDAVNTYSFEDFSQLVETLVMQDPDTFDDIYKADIDKITAASIWHCILSQDDNHYKDFDDRGFTVIPSEDIINTASKLFGSSYSLELVTPKQGSFYEISEDKKYFHVKPISNHNSFLPRIDDYTVNGKDVILKVSYIAGNDPYRLRPKGEVDKPTAQKCMSYTLKLDDKTDEYYIYSVKNQD